MSVSVYELWSSGTPLERAWVEFAESWSPEGVKTRSAYLAFERPIRALKERWPIPDGYRQNFEDGDFEFIERKRAQWEKNLKLDLLTQLACGDCVAYGKPWLPIRSEDVVAIPSLMFAETDCPPTVDFAGNQVTARGTAFVEIKVLSQARLAEISVPVASRRRGPRSYKSEIELVVKELMASDKDWLKRSFKQRHLQIIAKAKERFNYIEGRTPRGFGRTVIDEVIEKLLHEQSML